MRVTKMCGGRKKKINNIVVDFSETFKLNYEKYSMKIKNKIYGEGLVFGYWVFARGHV